MGLLNGLAFFFAPGVRRLAFYKRIPIAILPFAFWFHWYNSFARDQMMVIGKTMMENWERDSGARHYQTGH